MMQAGIPVGRLLVECLADRRQHRSTVIPRKMVGNHPLSLQRLRPSLVALRNEGCKRFYAASYLTRRCAVIYSSLRRKKIHSLSGDWNLHARFQSEQLRKAEPSFLEGMFLLYGGHLSTASSKPSLALTDTVVLRGFAPRTPKSKAKAGKGLGEGSWACARSSRKVVGGGGG